MMMTVNYRHKIYYNCAVFLACSILAEQQKIMAEKSISTITDLQTKISGSARKQTSKNLEISTQKGSKLLRNPNEIHVFYSCQINVIRRPFLTKIQKLLPVKSKGLYKL